MTKDKTITVKIETNKQRLDIFLSRKLKLSRSQVQKKIAEQQITVNDKQPKKNGDLVKNNDLIVIKAKTTKKNVKKDTAIKTEKKFGLRDIKIVEENNDYIIVNKPCGLLVHPTEAKEKYTLSSLLVKKYPEIKTVGENAIRPGIVHRLDKDASGIMVVVRTQKMFNHLKQQFKKRKIKKEYLVLVHGKIEADNGTINFPLVRSRNTERMAALPANTGRDGQTKLKDISKQKKLEDQYKKSKDAKTEFEVEKRYINFTLLRVKISTGRMHQIRVHMLAYNHPVIGDTLYYQKKQNKRYDNAAGRLFLHSYKLGFKDLSKKTQEYQVDLPDELKKFLTKYEKK